LLHYISPTNKHFSSKFKGKITDNEKKVFSKLMEINAPGLYVKPLPFVSPNLHKATKLP